MSPGKFSVSYAAIAQLALLSAAEKSELAQLFSGQTIQPANTQAIDDGRFVSRLGRKRVLWRKGSRQKPEIISIIDKSFARG